MSEGFQGVGKVLIASSHFARISSKAKGILAASGLEIVERGHLAPFTEASLPNEDFGRRYGIRYVGLDELLGLSDFVTLHVPLSERTLGLIGAPQLARMKSTAHLVNTSRGRVIDEVALVAALTEGRIAGAALDVFETEPSRRTELLSLENVIPTPHMGASTVEALERMSLMAAEDVVLALKGQRPRHLVNGEVLSLGAG
ncbi:MAG: NAD(P)-dependent oxidoreductase [Chloroflexota bacterium]